jgi:Tol biopolymer transport system component
VSAVNSMPGMQRRAYLAAAAVAAILIVWLTIVRLHASAPSAGLPAHLLFGRTSYPDKGTIYLATPRGNREVEQRLTKTGAYGLGSLSPDHEKILVMPGGDIPPPITGGMINLAGGDFKRLQLHDRTLNLVPDPWSPDGKRIAFEGWDDSNPSRTGVYIANAANGRGLVRLTTRPGRYDDEPMDFSPDGKWLVIYRRVAADPDPQVGGSLWVVGVDGSGLHKIAGKSRRPADWARWSRNGDRILFANERTAPSGAIWTVRPDGTHLTKVFSDPHGGFPIQPVWSPDGTQIAFALDSTNDQFTHPPNKLCVMDADGNHLHVLIGDNGFKTQPEWW